VWAIYSQRLKISYRSNPCHTLHSKTIEKL
jgi:hypothetical protein